MPEPAKAVHWEELSERWHSSSIGYIVKEGGAWVAHAYHNQRTGVAWTETKRGFLTACKARRWVESRGEA